MNYIESFIKTLESLPNKLPEKAYLGDVAKDENGVLHVFAPQGFIELDKANKTEYNIQAQ